MWLGIKVEASRGVGAQSVTVNETRMYGDRQFDPRLGK